jgi:hypothetical protein
MDILGYAVSGPDEITQEELPGGLRGDAEIGGNVEGGVAYADGQGAIGVTIGDEPSTSTLTMKSRGRVMIWQVMDAP